MRARLIWWNLAAVLVVWGIAESGAYLWMGHGVSPVIAPATLALRVSALFDGPIVAAQMDARRLHAVVPRSAGTEARRDCVLFFGCSYTYGEGVDDDEVFSHLVEAASGGRVESLNFGVSGSAPHYALGQVEDGAVRSVVDCDPIEALYLVIPHHLLRVSGKWFTPFGPRYVVQPDGTLVRRGWLTTASSEFVFEMLRSTSTLYAAKFGDPYNHGDPGPEDIRLTAAILRELAAKLRSEYPRLSFDVLYWDDSDAPFVDELASAVSAMGLRLHRVSAFLPEIRDPRSRAYLPNDPHPSAWAHQRLADHITQVILDE